ncbi:hypothetical protein [Fusobacterium massiliense]|uniref:hypothetical protein n=1 Tax=Fusobacterium massiliense TaxID=1852365 RepID=UPI0028E9D0D2|nr:hypothetical protein [Fusobacterium massiliense]
MSYLTIKSILQKDIERKINGVVKADSNEKDTVITELNEYVVTEEIRERLTKFFDKYVDSINFPTDEMLKNLSKLDLINQDIVTLKDGINVANSENFIENKSLFALLEEVRLKRNILFDLEYLLKRDSTTVENGVGVVQYGVLNKKELMERFNKLENEVNSLSEKIDNINSKTEIEVKLVSRL